MNKALISLGSNDNPQFHLDISRRMLREHFWEVLFTNEMETVAYGKHYEGMFINQLAVVYANQLLDEVQEITKEIEKLLGRLPEHKQQGIVKVDIDVFGWNGEIIRPDDYHRPYVQGLLPQLEEIMKR